MIQTTSFLLQKDNQIDDSFAKMDPNWTRNVKKWVSSQRDIHTTSIYRSPTPPGTLWPRLHVFNVPLLLDLLIFKHIRECSLIMEWDGVLQIAQWDMWTSPRPPSCLKHFDPPRCANFVWSHLQIGRIQCIRTHLLIMGGNKYLSAWVLRSETAKTFSLFRPCKT